ncbi:hypothetical protein [Fodinicola feengrottensis]|uniref:hypothetical protein n=1 Tax=Fodinicola feengrottensis TaxID=435914 RepID=UPI00244289AE|nr:hypothetical protein [Fodinicola feengrottensis]
MPSAEADVAAPDQVRLRERVTSALRSFLTAREGELVEIGPEFQPFSDALTSFLLNGGETAATSVRILGGGGAPAAPTRRQIWTRSRPRWRRWSWSRHPRSSTTI